MSNKILMIVGVSATVVISIVVVLFFLQDQTDRMIANAEYKHQQAVDVCRDLIDAHEEVNRAMGNYTPDSPEKFEICMKTAVKMFA